MRCAPVLETRTEVHAQAPSAVRAQAASSSSQLAPSTRAWRQGLRATVRSDSTTVSTCGGWRGLCELGRLQKDTTRAGGVGARRALGFQYIYKP